MVLKGRGRYRRGRCSKGGHHNFKGKIYEMIAETIYNLGEDSGFFNHRDDVEVLGEFKKRYFYGVGTWVDVYKNGCSVYHLGNEKKYKNKKEAFRAAKILGQREKELRRVIEK